METINTEQNIDTKNNKWYTLKVLSNFEQKAQKLIEKKLEQEPESKEHIAKFQNEEVPKSYYDIGQLVSILDGPFMGLQGSISEVDVEHQKLKVLVSIFGRDTPVELENWQVERVEEE